jgi:ubiquitin carboxyl-terminal hydrolase 7
MKYIFCCFLRYVGRLFVMGSRKPVDILMKLNEMAGFAPDEEIDLFEVSQSLHLIYNYLP